MKILVIADIHANWPALSAIDETYDACLCVGDIVEYGANPIPCIDWIRKNATATVRGNHDHATAQRVPGSVGGGFRMLAATTREHHAKVLRPTDIKYLSRLPVTQTVTLGGQRFFLVHATPRDPMDEYLGNDPYGWQQRLGDINTDFVICGHTHLQLHLKFGNLQLVNPGSVGQPRDGDNRAAYAIIENGQVQLKRVEYDIEQAVRELAEANLPPEAFNLAADVLRTGGRRNQTSASTTQTTEVEAGERVRSA